ncbi:MAG: TolC family protein [Planctomycetota bacterium]|nr:MAG: TolC family protein [Planctomycetota bacterium]
MTLASTITFSAAPERRCLRGILVAVLAAGCTVAHPQPDPGGAIARSLEFADAVAFRSEGGPIDARAGPADALSVASALRRGVETSPELQAALARVRAAQADAELAALLPNPILSIVLRFPEGGGSPDVEAGLAADLLAILQRPRRASAAGNRLEAEVANALSTALDVVAGIEQRYSEVQALEALVVVLEQRLTVLDRLREVAQARLDFGQGTRHDVTALDAERMLLGVELDLRRRELRVARFALSRAIGEPSGSATWTLDPWSPFEPIPATEQAWIDAALEHRPELLAIEWELRAREDEEALAGGRALDGASAGVEAERDGEWSLGPSISTPLPLFDTGQARRERARALTSEQRHRLTQARRGVVEDVRSALETFVGAQESLERIVDDLIPLQERRRAEIAEAFQLGLVDATALLFADQALQQSQARRIDVSRAVTSAHIRLQRSVGGPSVLRSVLTWTPQQP